MYSFDLKLLSLIVFTLLTIIGMYDTHFNVKSFVSRMDCSLMVH